MEDLAIVFKFRDEINFTPNSLFSGECNITLPSDYEQESKYWSKKIFDYLESNHSQMEMIDIDGNQNFHFLNKNLREKDFFWDLIQNLKHQISKFHLLLKSIANEKRYLFDYLDTNSFKKLITENLNPQNLSRDQIIANLHPSNVINSRFPNVLESDLPNFFNYFILRYNPNFGSENDFKSLIDGFEEFLPHKNNYLNHLLDFAYLRGTPIECSHGNADYFTDLDINIAPTITTSFQKKITISIVEVNRWNLEHDEFKNSGNEPVIIFPKSNLDQILPTQHGNAVLGVLKSKNTGLGDISQGLIPHAKFQLSSLNNVKRNNDTTTPDIDDVKCEANAILAAISKSNFGDVILIEFQNFNGTPIEFQPAIYQLIRLASLLNMILIEAAGNESLNIDNLKKRRNLKSTLKLDEIWENLEELQEQEIFAELNKLEKCNFKYYLKNVQSGAILVGAFSKVQNEPNNPIFKVLNKSNFGKDVMIFANGDDINAPSGGNNNYSPFGYTSLASAIVAGVVVLIQSVLKDHGTIGTNEDILRYLILYSSDNKIMKLEGSNWTSTTRQYIPSFNKILAQIQTA